MKTIFIASDHAGFYTKQAILEHISQNYLYEFSCEDLGTNTSNRTDYTNFAHTLSQKVQNNFNSIGILICGSGVGVSIVANRYHSVRAALIYNKEIAKLSRQHNDANVACFGSRFFSNEEIINMVDIFLKTQFSEGIHLERVKNIEL